MVYKKHHGITFVVERPDGSHSIRRFNSDDLDQTVLKLLEKGGCTTEGREFWIAVQVYRQRYGETENYTKVNDCTTVEAAYNIAYNINRLNRCGIYEEDLSSVHIIDQVEGYAPDFWFDPEPADLSIVKTKGLLPSPKFTKGKRLKKRK